MSEIRFLGKLYSVIRGRKGGDPKASYTAQLFGRGREKIAQKFGEEAVELVIEAVRGKKKKAILESADLLYHLMVLWADMGISIEDVEKTLEERHGVSGLDEKKKRKKK